jgi:ferredoxin-NADP reductase
VLLATGTGYAGIKPLLLTALARDAEVALYWVAHRRPISTTRFSTRPVGRTHFRWYPVLAGQARIQQVALGQPHRETQVYACGNPAMISQAREQCLAAGGLRHRFVAEAFVASGARPPRLQQPARCTLSWKRSAHAIRWTACSRPASSRYGPWPPLPANCKSA